MTVSPCSNAWALIHHDGTTVRMNNGTVSHAAAFVQFERKFRFGWVEVNEDIWMAYNVSASERFGLNVCATAIANRNSTAPRLEIYGDVLVTGRPSMHVGGPPRPLSEDAIARVFIFTEFARKEAKARGIKL